MDVVEDVGRCPNCSAPVDLSPDTVVLICSYCGQASTFEGAHVKPVMMACEDVGVVRAAAERFVRSKVRDAIVREVKTLVVPFWVVELNVITRYNGYRRETRTRSTGRQTSTYAVYIPVKGVMRERVAVAVYGRRFESIFGLGQAKNSLLNRRMGTQPIDPQQVKGWSVIGSELTEREAVEAAKTRAAEEHRKRVEAMTSKVFDCYTEATPTSSKLVLYPVVQARYESAGKSYRVCLDGVRGSVKLLLAELPLTMRGRVARAVATAAAVAAISLASSLLQPLVFVDELPGELRLAVIASTPVASIVVGAFGAYTAAQEQRLMKAVAEKDLVVLGGF